MAELFWMPGEIRLREPGQKGGLRARDLVRVMLPAGQVGEVPVTGLRNPHTVHGAGNGFAADAMYTDRGIYFDVDLRVTYTGAEPLECGLQVAYELMGAGEPTWLIPGIFYGQNRLPQCTRFYPAYRAAGGRTALLESDHWAFRADRAALPAVFAWNEELCGALAVDEFCAAGQAGVGFAGGAQGAWIHLNFPYREAPVVYPEPGKTAPPDCPVVRWTPGQQEIFRYRVYLAGPDRHAYDPFIRAMYERDAERHPLNPWMGLAEAAELTAHGLYTWHYRPEQATLVETVGFLNDSERPNMHVGWVSGAPYAFALLATGKEPYVSAGRAVLDKIASGLTPAGTFWGEWRGDRGWSCGWTPDKKWIHTRTIAEATLFMIRALRLEPRQAAWRAAIESNLRYVTSIQREDGSFGTYYHCDTGAVTEWEGAGGILWIAALLEGAALLGDPAWTGAAVKAGDYYGKFIRDEFLYGAPEDVHLAPTSEDGYNAVIAYVALYGADRQPRWLELARRAAEWTMTFRWTYNLEWPEHTILRHYDFRSRGADLASPSNQHLHNYGLVCLPEMLKLYEWTGDRYYLDRTRDNLACFLQFIARADGDFNAMKGMVTERWFNTNCFSPKGMILTLSHSWCIGMVLYACQQAAGRIDL